MRRPDWKKRALNRLRSWNTSLGFSRPGHHRPNFYARFTAATLEMGRQLAEVLNTAVVRRLFPKAPERRRPRRIAKRIAQRSGYAHWGPRW